MKLGETLGLSPNFQQLNMVKQELEKNEKIFEAYQNKFVVLLASALQLSVILSCA